MSCQPGFRALTEAERAAALAIAPSRVIYLPGSPDKRFAAHIAGQASLAEGHISEAQAAYLHRLVRRYRRQVPAAERLLAEMGE